MSSSPKHVGDCDRDLWAGDCPCNTGQPAPCPDCSAEMTCAEVTAPDGRKFVTVHDVAGAVLLYRPDEGYTVREVTGRACGNRENHGG
jgi:hypothetical protein